MATTPKWLGGKVYEDSTHRFVTDTEKSTWNGKAEKNHTHSYLPLSGGTITGSLKVNAESPSINIVDSSSNKGIMLGTNSIYGWNGSSSQPLSINPDGGLVTIGSGGLTTAGKITATGGFAGNATTATTATKVSNSLTVQFNGTTKATFNGSAANTINITPSAIGAAASSHTHLYAGSTTAGGAAQSVANNMIIQFNGTTKATYNGSAAKTVDITPAAIGALALTPPSGTGVITGNLRVAGGGNASVTNAYVQAWNAKGANLFLSNLKVQWSLGLGAYDPFSASLGSALSISAGSLYSSGGGEDVPNTGVGTYTRRLTIGCNDDDAMYYAGSILSTYNAITDDSGNTFFAENSYTRSVRANTPRRAIALYNVKDRAGLYLFDGEEETYKGTNPGWLLYYDDSQSLVRISRTVSTQKIVLTATSGLNWRTPSGTDNLLIGYGSNDNYTNFTRVGNTSYQMSLYTSNNVWKNGSTTTYFATTTTSSDERLKERVSDMSKYEEFFSKINPFAFKYHDGLYNAPNKKPLIIWGYSAQETIAAFKECGINWEDQDLVVVEDAELSEEEAKYVDDGKLLKMSYQNMIPLNTHMIQKLMDENKNLKNENSELKSRLSVIESALSRIMNRLDM